MTPTGLRPLLALPLVALLLGACAPILSGHRTDTSPERLFSVGFRNLSERYIEPVDLGEVSIAGLAKLSEIDPGLDVAASGGNVVLMTNQMATREWRSPEREDTSGWAGVMAEAVAAARTASPVARTKPAAAVADAMFHGVMTSLDRYSRYSDPELARRNRASRDGFGGLGISIKLEAGITRIIKVHPGTPAARAGLRDKDRITHVDDQPINGLEQREIVTILRGPRNSIAKLRIERDAPTSPLDIEVTRARIILPTVTAKRLDGLLLLEITGFNQGTAAAVSRELTAAEHEMGKSLKGVILDLRGNPGGLLDQAVMIADLFLTDGLIISTRGRHYRSQQIFDASWGELVPEVPVAVLVNGKSASAAEIVAVALRDRGRAVVIGSSSYGKGTVQTIIALPNGGEMTLTWARMHAPSGFALQDHGIIPAICTSGDVASRDALIAALSGRRQASAGLLAGVLQARLQRRSDPDLAREACPPAAEKPKADLEIARSLLLDRNLYQRALADGRPAIAARRTTTVVGQSTP